MSQRKKGLSEDEIFHTSIADDILRSGDVVRILGIERWRLEKFITGTQYQLSPSGQLGKGKGSWRLFGFREVYRLAIASRMVDDGFTAKFVSLVLQEIEDSDLIDIDSTGEPYNTDLGIFRSPKGPFVRSLQVHEKGDPYYVLKLTELLPEIDKRIKEVKRRK